MGVSAAGFLLEKGIDPTFTTIGGFQTRSMSINAETVDVTSVDNINRFRELLPSAGIKTVSFSGSGVVNDSAAQKAMVTDCLAQTVDDYRVTVPGLGTFEGKFQIPQFEGNGEHAGEMQFSTTIESGGDITFTVAA